MKTMVVAGVLVIGLAAGSAATYFLLRQRINTHSAPAAAGGASSPAARPGGAAPSGPASVTLTPDAIARAKIRTQPATTARIAGETRVPATIEPNAYKHIVVTAIVGGRVTRVAAELGQHVRRGATVAQLYSPELAEAQRAYISGRAELRAHEQQLARTERLVQIGAASQQELERDHAEHTMMTTGVEGASSKLELLGMSRDQIATLTSSASVTSTIDVPAPIDGVVISREANSGLNVEAGAPLMTIVDLSTVWAVGAIYEMDAAAVRRGDRARVIVAGLPELSGTISYIDPQVSAETRATKIRVEVPNTSGALRLGMYADILLASASAREAVVVPKSAVQTVGAGAVVYVEDRSAPGRFVERAVQTGAANGTDVEVTSGVSAGERVVTEGSFFVRAERERLGPSAEAPAAAGTPATSAAAPATSAATPAPSPTLQTARVTITAKGFEPDHLTLKAGAPARITFVRTTDQTCATDVVFPSLNIKRALPLNQPVDVEFVPQRGDVAFACGMDMLKGAVTVQ